MCEKAVEEMDVLTGIENADIFGNISLPQLFDVICQERSCLAVHLLSWSTAYIFFHSWERNVLWHPLLFGLHPSGTISGIAAPHVGVMFHV